MNNNTSLTIISTAIRQDAERRYRLNDCHKASGGSANKRPGEWLRNEQTQSLIRELTDAGISASPVSSIKGGPEQGTYIAKELVYAYAIWINPAFHLAVIRAFDSMMSGKVPQPQIPNHAEALRLAADQAEITFCYLTSSIYQAKSASEFRLLFRAAEETLSIFRRRCQRKDAKIPAIVKRPLHLMSGQPPALSPQVEFSIRPSSGRAALDRL